MRRTILAAAALVALAAPARATDLTRIASLMSTEMFVSKHCPRMKVNYQTLHMMYVFLGAETTAAVPPGAIEMSMALLRQRELDPHGWQAVCDHIRDADRFDTTTPRLFTDQ